MTRTNPKNRIFAAADLINFQTLLGAAWGEEERDEIRGTSALQKREGAELVVPSSNPIHLPQRAGVRCQPVGKRRQLWSQ